MYCPKCGTSAAEDQNFCKLCGAALSSPATESTRTGAMPPPLPAARPRPVPPDVPASPSVTSVAREAPRVYARLWRRLLAIIIDYVIVSFLIVGLTAIHKSLGLNDEYFGLELLVLIWLYKAVFESSKLQATPGKLALGIKVTATSGERLSFLRASGRFFAQILSSFVFGLGYMIAGFTQKRQALHDLIASTLVIDRKRTPAEIMVAPPAAGAEGIVLLVLLIPAIGILAAIAIPAYQDYTIRAQTAEGLNLADSFKVYTAEYYSVNVIWPTDRVPGDDSSRDALPRIGAYIRSINMPTPGTITITYGNRANQLIAGKTVSFNAYLDDSGNINWLCGTRLGAAGLKPVGAGATTVPPKYLPLACKQ